MMKITLKDGSVKEYAEAKSVYDIALDISGGLARAACAGEVDGRVVDLRTSCLSASRKTKPLHLTITESPCSVKAAPRWSSAVSCPCGSGKKYKKCCGRNK